MTTRGFTHKVPGRPKKTSAKTQLDRLTQARETHKFAARARKRAERHERAAGIKKHYREVVAARRQDKLVRQLKRR